LSKDAAGKKKSNGQDKEQNKIKHKKQKDMSNEDKDSQSHVRILIELFYMLFIPFCAPGLIT